MSPKNKKVRSEKELKCTEKMAELENSLKEKTKLEETYLNQLRYARADLENLQKQIRRYIDEGVTKEKERLIIQLLPVVEEVDLALLEVEKVENSCLLEGLLHCCFLL